MSNKLTLTYSLLIMLTMLACSISLPSHPPGGRNLQTEEYALYSDLIASEYIGSGIGIVVVQEKASLGYGSEDLKKSLEYVRKNLPELTEKMVGDFISNNRDPYVFQPMFNIDIPVILFSNEDMDEIFSNSGGWDAFYQRYPDAPGIINLSRPGFNPDMNEAMIYIGMQSDYLAGAGYYYYLEKESGHWVVKNRVMTWIS